MMFTELNASGYDHNGEFYNAEFEDILSKVIVSYHLMLSDNVLLVNDENKIRDVLYLNYLNNDVVRKNIGLLYYYFDRETSEDRSIGRTDIRILTANSFLETAAYYIIECKRLDATNLNGTTGLNSKYITNGIYRFISKSYSAHYRTNGMIGFVVQTLDINQNIGAINQLLRTDFKQANTTEELKSRKIISDFEFSYCSTHKAEEDYIIIYHLMLDFSKLVLQN
jgi:hypothetical protein